MVAMKCRVEYRLLPPQQIRIRLVEQALIRGTGGFEIGFDGCQLGTGRRQLRLIDDIVGRSWKGPSELHGSILLLKQGNVPLIAEVRGDSHNNWQSLFRVAAAHNGWEREPFPS